MFSSTSNELAQIADKLYEMADDDDGKLAELMRELPPDIAHALCTSNLTNAAQAYIYAFNEYPPEEIYDLLLLKSSSLLPQGIILETVELSDILFRYDKNTKSFLISTSIDDKVAMSFSSQNALQEARLWAQTFSD